MHLSDFIDNNLLLTFLSTIAEANNSGSKSGSNPKKPAAADTSKVVSDNGEKQEMQEGNGTTSGVKVTELNETTLTGIHIK